jgi:hypothetical protein
MTEDTSCGVHDTLIPALRCRSLCTVGGIVVWQLSDEYECCDEGIWDGGGFCPTPLNLFWNLSVTGEGGIVFESEKGGSGRAD